MQFNKEFWFGWFYKRYLNVSVLDNFVALGEVTLFILVTLTICYLVDRPKRKR